MYKDEKLKVCPSMTHAIEIALLPLRQSIAAELLRRLNNLRPEIPTPPRKDLVLEIPTPSYDRLPACQNITFPQLRWRAVKILF